MRSTTPDFVIMRFYHRSAKLGPTTGCPPCVHTARLASWFQECEAWYLFKRVLHDASSSIRTRFAACTMWVKAGMTSSHRRVFKPQSGLIHNCSGLSTLSISRISA